MDPENLEDLENVRMEEVVVVSPRRMDSTAPSAAAPVGVEAAHLVADAVALPPKQPDLGGSTCLLPLFERHPGPVFEVRVASEMNAAADVAGVEVVAAAAVVVAVAVAVAVVAAKRPACYKCSGHQKAAVDSGFG